MMYSGVAHLLNKFSLFAYRKAATVSDESILVVPFVE